MRSPWPTRSPTPGCRHDRGHHVRHLDRRPATRRGDRSGRVHRLPPVRAAHRGRLGRDGGRRVHGLLRPRGQGGQPRRARIRAAVQPARGRPVRGRVAARRSGRGDTVFHLAAQPGVRGSFGPTFAGYARDNILATQRVFEGAREAGCRRVVWASSSSVYGDAPGYPTVESDPTRPRSPYGVTKRACEDLARVYAGRRPRPGRAAVLHGLRTPPAAGHGHAAPVRRRRGAARRSRSTATDCSPGTSRSSPTRATRPCGPGPPSAPRRSTTSGGGAEVTLAEVVATVERLAGGRCGRCPGRCRAGTSGARPPTRRRPGATSGGPRVGLVDGPRGRARLGGARAPAGIGPGRGPRPEDRRADRQAS